MLNIKLRGHEVPEAMELSKEFADYGENHLHHDRGGIELGIVADIPSFVHVHNLLFNQSIGPVLSRLIVLV